MEEIKNDALTTAQDENTEAVSEETAEAPAKKKLKMPAWLKKVSDFLKAHENLRQMVFFIMFSLVCFAIEYITYTILDQCLKGVVSPIDVPELKYHATLGVFIAFLISNIIAQICTFILNRKKTFKATNNVIISGLMYAILVVIIILLNTYLGGVITEAFEKAYVGNNGMITFGGYVGKFAGSFLSFVINFVGCKFLVMRNWGKKNAKVDLSDDELLAQAAADSADVE
ncbi:MAG: GtrA family protein [Clostridia bacterium]|nr:GtrA family protein [Clostridia bacterium]